MKTAKEKAKDIVDGLPFAVAAHRSYLEQAIVTALEEQDRDTRHACSDSANREIYRQYDLRGDMTENGISAVCDAIMNTKAV